MHTPALLQKNVRHLGRRGVAEIEAVSQQWNWTLPLEVDESYVALIRLITAVLWKAPYPLTLSVLTEKVNFFNQDRAKTNWSAGAVATGAERHPYVEMLDNGKYRLKIRPVDVSPPLPTSYGDGKLSEISNQPCYEKLESSVIWNKEQAGLSGKEPLLDFDLLKEFKLFSKRVTNVLVRAGICTSRLLLMHTPDLLMREVKKLGAVSVAEIEAELASCGWKLAEFADARYVTLIRLLTAATYNVSHPLHLSTIVTKITQNHGYFTQSDIMQAMADHPYLVEVGDDFYQLTIRPVQSIDRDRTAPTVTQLDASIPAAQQNGETAKLQLDVLWFHWLVALDEKVREVLFLRYGVHGEKGLTLAEVGEMLHMSRERVRQIEEKGLTRLGNRQHQPYWRPLRQLLAQGIQEAGGLLALDQWERILDENAVWEAEEPHPQLLPLLCAVLDDYHFLNRLNAATVSHIKSEHLTQLDGILKKILRQHKQEGLSADELVQEAQRQRPSNAPPDVYEPAFIIRVTDFFERVGPGKNGRYFYLKQKKKTRNPAADSGWAGEPGTRLHDWEMKLRQQFEKVAWVGQISLTEDDFKVLCQIIQEEAQAPNIHTKIVEGQPRLVPPAVFLTTMTLSARLPF